jgi:hypothetical protein
MSPTPEAFDQSQHLIDGPAPAWTAAAAATTAPGTIIPVPAGSGAGSSVAIAATNECSDNGGTFQLTTAGTPAAGIVAAGFWSANYQPAPLPIVLVEVTDTTASPIIPVAASAVASATGFTIQTTILTTAHVYSVTYTVQQP